jgi:hypothetical protein
VATDGVAFLIKSLDHLLGKWVRRECCRIIDGVCIPLSLCIFIERGESCVGMSPLLYFIHGPLGHKIVVRQFISGNTFEIRYVIVRLMNHDRRGGGVTTSHSSGIRNICNVKIPEQIMIVTASPTMFGVTPVSLVAVSLV